MRIRNVAWPIAVALTSACRGPAAQEPLDPAAEVQRLIDHMGELEACTATYVFHGPVELTVRFTYRAPDRARLEITGTNDSKQDGVTWVLGNRAVIHSQDANGPSFGDLPLYPERLVAAWKEIDEAVDRAFPSTDTSDARRDLGDGATLGLWFEPDRDDPEHGAIDINAGWMPNRDHVVNWLWHVLAMPVLRDEGDRIVAEDPATRLIVAVSKKSGFIERVSTGGGLSVALAEWKPAADPSSFEITPPPAGARDATDEWKRMYEAAAIATVDMSIEQTVVAQRKRATIGDDELRRRLAPVYYVALRTSMAGVLEEGRATEAETTEEFIDLVERLHTAASTDPDLRGQFDASVARIRESRIDGLAKIEKQFCAPLGVKGLDPSDPVLAEVRRQAARDLFEREIVRPSLDQFDQRVRAIREGK